MLINLVSDVHLEFYRKDAQTVLLGKILETECEVLVIAGDLFTQAQMKQALKQIGESKRETIYIVGNHEYYQQANQGTVHELLKKADEQYPNFHWLHNTEVEINSVKFAGTPMWHEFHAERDLADAYTLNDIHQIRDFAAFVVYEHDLAQKFLKSTTAQVVVTHHMPTTKCVSEKYKDDVCTKFFVHPILETLQNPPELWLYGHTHDRGDLMCGNTRVVGNPMGYPKEGAFYKECFLEI